MLNWVLGVGSLYLLSNIHCLELLFFLAFAFAFDIVFVLSKWIWWWWMELEVYLYMYEDSIFHLSLHIGCCHDQISLYPLVRHRIFYCRCHIICAHTTKCIHVLCTGILSCLSYIDRLHHCWVDLRNSAGPRNGKLQLNGMTHVTEMGWDDLLTVKSEFSPQMTSLSVRVGTQPRPSIEFCRNNDRQMSPVTDIFGCHSLVTHFTLGGCRIERESN